MAQRTLLQIVQAATSELGLPQPTAVMASQDQNVQKLLSLTRAVCDDLLAEQDWQGLQVRYTFATTSGQPSYPLPSDIERFINQTMFDATNQWPLRGPKTPVQWEWLNVSGLTTTPFNQFRIMGGQFLVFPTPGDSPYSFVFEYVSNNYVLDASTRLGKPDFTQDADVCVFDHRPVVYGVKLKFRESIGQDTGAALADYERALEFAKGSDQPAPVLSLLGRSGLRLLSTDNYPDGSWVT